MVVQTRTAIAAAAVVRLSARVVTVMVGEEATAVVEFPLAAVVPEAAAIVVAPSRSRQRHQS